MLNHARTLLLNIPGQHLEQLDVPGDVYIPAYEPVVLPANLNAVRTLLLGSAPDYDGLVYRAGQYMGLLGSTEYAPYVTAMDPRLTYDAANLTVMDDALFTVMVSGDRKLSVTGTWAGAGVDGRSLTTWRVTTPTVNTVKVDNLVDGSTITYNMADVKTLIGSDYRISIADQTYTPGEQWYVQDRSRPQPSLGVVLANIRLLSLGTIETVFGNTAVEPNKTFFNLYKHHYAFPYQLSGFVFAYIQRVEELRTHVV